MRGCLVGAGTGLGAPQQSFARPHGFAKYSAWSLSGSRWASVLGAQVSFSNQADRS